MNRIRVFMIVMIVSSILAVMFTGLVTAERNGCTSITDVVDIVGDDGEEIEIDGEEMEESPFYNEESEKFVITGDDQQWIQFVCWALTN